MPLTTPILLSVSGLTVGTLIGTTGVGGGALMTPLLILGFGLPPVTAVGTDMVYASLTQVVGGWSHWRQGTVATEVVRDLALGSVPASVLAVGLVAWMARMDISVAQVWIQRGIALTLGLAAALLARRALRGGRPVTPIAGGHRRWWITGVGALVGFLVGLTSVGSGSLIMAVLVFMLPLSADVLVGTDVTHAAILVGTAGLANLGLGHVDLPVVGWLLLGSIPGALIGSRLASRLPKRGLQGGLAALLLGVAWRILS